MPESRTLEGPIHPLARDVRGSHGRQRQGAAASVDRWGRYRLAVGDVSRGVPECHCPTPSTTGLVPGAGTSQIRQSVACTRGTLRQVRSGRAMENHPLKIGHRLRPDIGSATSIARASNENTTASLSRYHVNPRQRTHLRPWSRLASQCPYCWHMHLAVDRRVTAAPEIG
ncbi:hypothetical protein CI102_12647 [Trichoderma harzianum]|nr:hypothetical protein CI102_12647 [Trichoderma harzianum]